MSASNNSIEANTTANDSCEEDILASINKLIDRKLELSLATYAKSLATDVDFSSLVSNYHVQSEWDRLKIRVRELIDTHGSNLEGILRNEFGLENKARPEDPQPSSGELNVSHGNVKHATRLADLSPMARKFLAADEDDVWQVDKDTLAIQEAAEREKKKPYFFYGSLMDASTLQRVLGLEDRPQLQPASIVGYHIKMWGPYPALQDGPPGNAVHGMMWEVEGAKRKDRLAEYETLNYKEWGCIIELEDGSSVRGTTFMWNGDTKELKEGSFDLKDWQMDQLDR